MIRKLSAFLLVVSVFMFLPGASTPPVDLDSSLGGWGVVTTSFGGVNAEYLAAKILPDGKLIAAGFAYTYINNGQRSDLALARYNPDGSPDASFGTQGKLTANYGFQDSVNDAVLMPDGQIFVAGLASSEQKYVNGFEFLALYHSDGSLDPACGIDGVKNLTNYPIRIWTIAMEPDGRLILAGSGNMVAELMRLNILPNSCLPVRS